MSDNSHDKLLLSTGRFQFTREERDETIRRLMGDTVIELEEDAETTLELPIPHTRKK